MNPISDRTENMIDRLRSEYGHTLLVGHRGYAKDMDFHRNTFPAFKYAIEEGAHGLEADLRVTKDGKVVVHHNPWVREGLHVKRISTNTYEELLEVKETPEMVPQLKDVIEILPSDMLFFCQIKNPDHVEHILREILEHTSKPEQIIIMGYMKQVLGGDLPSEFTYGKHYLNPFDWNLRYIMDRREDGVDMDIASPMWNWLRDSHLQKIHDLNLQSVVFTVNPDSALKKMISKEVDVIYTDNLDVALDLV